MNRRSLHVAPVLIEIDESLTGAGKMLSAIDHCVNSRVCSSTAVVPTAAYLRTASGPKWTNIFSNIFSCIADRLAFHEPVAVRCGQWQLWPTRKPVSLPLYMYQSA